MAFQAAQVATICECIDHCFAFTIWCDDFARYLDPEDMFDGQERAEEVVSDAVRLHSFLALRKLDEFLSEKKAKCDDLVAGELGIDLAIVLGKAGEKFLTTDDRNNINKGVAHLTERLTLDPDSEVDLNRVVTQSLPAMSRLVLELRKMNTDRDIVRILDRTEALVTREIGIAADIVKDPHYVRP